MVTKFLILLLVAFVLFRGELSAQPFRYIDEAGNILWADSISDVPMQYRSQVIKPTAPPVYSPWQYRQMMKKKRKTPTPRPTRAPKPTKTPRHRPNLTPTVPPLPPQLPTPTATPTHMAPMFGDSPAK